jgi:hypothetical protein
MTVAEVAGLDLEECDCSSGLVGHLGPDTVWAITALLPYISCHPRPDVPDRITPKEGFQVSKREWKGSNRELTRGVKQGDCAIIMLSICIHVYNNCLNF